MTTPTDAEMTTGPKELPDDNLDAAEGRRRNDSERIYRVSTRFRPNTQNLDAHAGVVFGGNAGTEDDGSNGGGTKDPAAR